MDDYNGNDRNRCEEIMRRLLAVVLCILIGVQGMILIPGGMKVQAEDMAENTEGNEGENVGETEGKTEQGGIDREETGQEESGGEETQDEVQDGGASAGVEVSAPSAILMEASTGKIIYEKDADTRRPPASVTKVMTLLLIFDALADNRITLEDEVQTSEYAASMGGSQVFLEPGETQTVDTMIKCIAVASANDACVSFKNSRQYLYPVECSGVFSFAAEIWCTNGMKSDILYTEAKG